jgi:signal transduction histidine kinase
MSTALPTQLFTSVLPSAPTARPKPANLGAAIEEAHAAFISHLCHEMSTQLGSIFGHLELLADGEAGALTTLQREFVRNGHVGAQRLKDMLDGLLELDRIGAGRVEFERLPMDLADVLREVTGSFAAAASTRGLELHTSIEAAVPILGNRRDLAKAFSNLVTNAISYTPRGSVTVTARNGSNQAEVFIEDTGIGVRSEDRARLFTRFFRADHPIVHEAGGTGLGLVIAKEIVEAHGGQIEVESEPGRGTKFKIALPTGFRTAV